MKGWLNELIEYEIVSDNIEDSLPEIIFTKVSVYSIYWYPHPLIRNYPLVAVRAFGNIIEK